MKTKLTKAALSALLMAAMAVLAACGSDDAGSGSAQTGTTSTAAVAGDPTDRAFIAMMVPHHQSAVAMAKLAQSEGQSEFVKRLADDIVTSQNEEIATMRRIDSQLADAGVRTGELGMDDHAMGMDMDAGELEGARPFDAKFIEMMVPHHEGAVEMARVELREGQNTDLKQLAQNIITAQQREVTQMNAHRDGSDSVTDDEMDSMDMGSEHHGG